MQRGQALVDDGITRRPSRGRTHPAGVVRTRGDLDPGLGQDGADRLDPVLVAVTVDERIDVGQRRSSSACAKYALARRRIVFARRSSRFSFSSSAMRIASSLVLPATSPASTRSERTQLRSVSALMPSRSPTSRQARETGNPGSSANTVAHQPHSSLAQLIGIPPRCRHDSILLGRSHPPPLPGRSTPPAHRLTDVHDSSPPDLSAVRSPKLTGGSSMMWYRYYAGFSPDFVKDVGTALGVAEGTRVLDPWMGSGTTLTAAAARHAIVAGLDLNPAMAVIAKGRLVAVDTENSVEPLLLHISRHYKQAADVQTADILSCWFDLKSVAVLRGLIARIDEVLVSATAGPVAKASEMSSIAAFCYVAAFRAVSMSLKGYGSRNPTWIKKSKPGEGVISLSRADLRDQFEQAGRHLAAYLRYRKQIPVQVRDDCRVEVGDSRSQPFADNSFDAVITSPPYLTRLDYVVGHLPELAVLGLSNEDISHLRERMIGTPKITTEFSPPVKLSPTSQCVVKAIEDHDSYASASYYAKNVRQYFVGMAASLNELHRVTRPGGLAALVVQDSHFKDVHIDLAAALTDQAAHIGWKPLGRKDFTSVRSIAQLNTRAHEKARTTKPIESLILLSAEGR